MSSEPAPEHVPVYDSEPPSRFRWVVPLFLGVIVGVMMGCLLTFVVLQKDRRSSEVLTAEKFSHSNLLGGVPGGETVAVTEHTSYLGRQFSRGQDARGSGVIRRFRFSGILKEDVDPGTFAKELKTRIETEIGRLAEHTRPEPGTTWSEGDRLLMEVEGTYSEGPSSTNEERFGKYDFYLTINNRKVWGMLIVTEGL